MKFRIRTSLYVFFIALFLVAFFFEVIPISIENAIQDEKQFGEIYLTEDERLFVEKKINRSGTYWTSLIGQLKAGDLKSFSLSSGVLMTLLGGIYFWKV